MTQESDAASLRRTIRHTLAGLIYTHKTHEKEIEVLSTASSWIRYVELALIALSAGGAISVLLGTGFGFKLTTAILATLATMATLINESFNPEHAITDHKRCARALWFMRERYINLIADLDDQRISPQEARLIRDELLREVFEIYRNAPNTSERAFLIAKAELKMKDDTSGMPDDIQDVILDWKSETHSTGQ